jgi:hypothetical protein
MTKILLWRVVICDIIVASKWSIFWESERSITNTNTSGALPLPDMLSPAALRGGYLGGPKPHQRQRMLFFSELSLPAESSKALMTPCHMQQKRQFRCAESWPAFLQNPTHKMYHRAIITLCQTHMSAQGNVPLREEVHRLEDGLKLHPHLLLKTQAVRFGLHRIRKR